VSGNASLARRTAGSLIFAQILAFPLAWAITLGLGLAGVERFSISWDELADYRTVRLVVDSIHRDSSGELWIEPGPDLAAEMIRVPALKFAAFYHATREPIRGSYPELVAPLSNMVKISSTHTHFVLPGDPYTPSLGFMEPLSTPYGRLQVAVYRQKFHWRDIFHVIREDLLSSTAYIVVAMAVSAFTTWFAVRRGLAPLRDAATDVSQIDWQSFNKRLLSSDVPVEVFPFVNAVNEALLRLDAWAARQRRFNANAAHELRTPLAIMRARLENAVVSPLRNELLGDTSRLRSIVEQMLVAARLTDGQAGKRDVDLKKTVGAIVAEMLPLAIDRDCYIDFESDEGKIYTLGNQRAIECVVTNLIDNALSAEARQKTVHVHVGSNGIISVIDHGEGVVEEDRDMIFEPFWRKNDTTSGTGLGLAIAKEVMDSLGGRIWVEDTPGGGATFKLSFALTNTPPAGSSFTSIAY
jgi:signal transduction histidine kinase